MPIQTAIGFSMNTYQIGALHLRSARRVAASLPYKIAPESPFFCVNRYRFRPGGNVIQYSVNKASVQSIETITDLELKKKRDRNCKVR